jgi:putative transposase
MVDTLTLLLCLQGEWDLTSIRRLSRIADAMVAMSGRVTMLGISRWSGAGGSYRSVQRWFSTAVPWAVLLVVFFRERLYQPNESYILAGDEVVVTKAGKKTYGVDRFFSSLYNQSVPGLAFFALSLVAVKERQAYPVSVTQVVRSAAEKTAIQAAKMKPKQAVGRPKGKKTTSKEVIQLTPELQRISGLLSALLLRLSGWLSVQYLVLDGHFGNHNALGMVRACGLHLISKLRHDAALYLPYQGENQRRKYGDKLDYNHLPDTLLQSTQFEPESKRTICTRIYQATCVHEQFPHPLNVVILHKTNILTGATSHIILFSSDLNLDPQTLIDYYRLRFQIEFNFRDAKQFWGLEDFMNVTQTTVTNAVHLSLLMVNLSRLQLTALRRSFPTASLLDLKAHARGMRYAQEIHKLLGQKLKPDLWNRILQRLSNLGRIHPSETPQNVA